MSGFSAEIKVDDRVTVSGSRFQVLQKAAYPVGWFECLQETGSAAVVGTKALLSPNMIATGNRAAPMPILEERSVAKKIWNLKYVVGNPAMFSRITSCADNPMTRADALASAEKVAHNGGGWRVWVERVDTLERIFESAAEKDQRAAQAA